MVAASCTARSSRLPSTTSLTRPMRCASRASIRRPVRQISRAPVSDYPAERGKEGWGTELDLRVAKRSGLRAEPNVQKRGQVKPSSHGWAVYCSNNRFRKMPDIPMIARGGFKELFEVLRLFEFIQVEARAEGRAGTGPPSASPGAYG